MERLHGLGVMSRMPRASTCPGNEGAGKAQLGTPRAACGRGWWPWWLLGDTQSCLWAWPALWFPGEGCAGLGGCPGCATQLCQAVSPCVP